MTHIMRPVLMLTLLLVMAGSPRAQQQQQQPSRLLVTNNTGTSVELFAAVKDTWQSRGRISPGSSMPVYNVTNGQRFRAVWGSKSKEHTVKLTYDRKYGGWQELLVLEK